MNASRHLSFLDTVRRRLAQWLDPQPSREQQREDAIAIEREHLANVRTPIRSYADEVQALIDQRNAEIEQEIAAQSPDAASPGDVWKPERVTTFQRKLRSVRK